MAQTVDLATAILIVQQIEAKLTTAQMNDLLDMIGMTLAENARLRFVDGAGPDGSPWDPLSSTTIARRRQGSSVPLRDTGRLMNSITHNVSNGSLSVGTNVVYGPTHQFGAKKGAYGKSRRGPIPWGDIPARPFLGVSDDDLAEIRQIVEIFLMP